MSQEKQSLQNSQNLSKDLMKEKAQLEKTLEALRENSERQVSSRINVVMLRCPVLLYRHKGIVRAADLPKGRICRKSFFQDLQPLRDVTHLELRLYCEF